MKFFQWMREYLVVMIVGWFSIASAVSLQATEPMPPAPSFWLSNLERDRFDSRTQAEPYLVSFFFVGFVSLDLLP
ncbi:MAG: hypothetical protein VW492_16840 [Deltaproteobacteria bacterium]